jgi:hypothetical protein
VALAESARLGRVLASFGGAPLAFSRSYKIISRSNNPLKPIAAYLRRVRYRTLRPDRCGSTREMCIAFRLHGACTVLSNEHLWCSLGSRSPSTFSPTCTGVETALGYPPVRIDHSTKHACVDSMPCLAAELQTAATDWLSVLEAFPSFVSRPTRYASRSSWFRLDYR